MLGTSSSFSLIYFTADPVKAGLAFEAGVDAVLVDCENRGKEQRQAGFDTQINYYTPEDVAKIKSANPGGRIFCRVNSAAYATNKKDIDAAIKAGADGIVLPLVELQSDVEVTREIIGKRALLIAMIETESGYQNVDTIVKTDIDAIYVGLNDLSISRGGRPLFEPLVDGTIEQIIEKSNVPVGVGGVTAPNAGVPLRSLDIIQEYQRLGVSFSLLRRSFEKTIQTRSMQTVVAEIKDAYNNAALRSRNEVTAHTNVFRLSLSKLAAGAKGEEISRGLIVP